MISDQFGTADSFTDATAAAVITRAIKIVVMLTLLGVPLVWVKLGWRSAALLLVGASISATGLLEWRRLMTALMVRMEPAAGEHIVGARRPSIGFALTGFFLRLFVVVGGLYVSLKYLNGSVVALAAGIAMGIFALMAESVRLLRNGTM